MQDVEQHYDQSNPQSAMTITREADTKLTTKKIVETVFSEMNSGVRELIERNIYRIALVIEDCTLVDHAVSAMQNPVSSVRVESLTVLEHIPKPNSTVIQDAKEWLDSLNLDSNNTEILEGRNGFEQVIKRDCVDAVYIFARAGHQRTYVLEALSAGKHVLLKDTVSTPRAEFEEQMEYAKKANKFIQFSTMSFLDCVCARNTFGKIQAIDAILNINMSELKDVNVSMPLAPGQGCIRRLSRYCVLITTLMLRPGDHKPISAAVLDSEIDEESGQPIFAECRIHFTNNVVLTCQTAYTTAPTRQVLTVKSRDVHSEKEATINDFVVAHKDGLATYRVYDKVFSRVQGEMVVGRGESIDVPLGPPQNVTLWREFHHLCNSIDRHGWSNAEAVKEAWDLTESSLQTKGILMALDESFKNGGTLVQVPNAPKQST